MKKQLIVGVLVFCVVTIMFIGFVRAQGLVLPGVSLGQDYQYRTYGYWTSTNAQSSIPSDLVVANQTQAIEVRIGDTNITSVSTFTATYYTFRQPYAAMGSLNIETGNATGQPWPAIIGANLTQGDIIHPLGSDGIKINETTAYQGRAANEIIISHYNMTSGITDTVDRFFDQKTGMLVKEVDTQTDDGSVSGSTYTSQITTLIASSPWNRQPINLMTQQPTGAGTNTPESNSGGNWTYYIAIVAVIIVAVAAIILLMLRKRQTVGRRKP